MQVSSLKSNLIQSNSELTRGMAPSENVSNLHFRMKGLKLLTRMIMRFSTELLYGYVSPHLLNKNHINIPILTSLIEGVVERFSILKAVAAHIEKLALLVKTYLMDDILIVAEPVIMYPFDCCSGRYDDTIRIELDILDFNDL